MENYLNTKRIQESAVARQTDIFFAMSAQFQLLILNVNFSFEFHGKMTCKTTEQVINHVISVQMPHFLSCFLSLYSVCNCNMMKYQFSFVKIFLPLFWPDFKNMMNFYLHFGQERVNVGDCGVEHIGGQVVPNLKKCICVFCILVFCSLPQICICCVYTLRHLNTWADPSLIPGEMPEV